MDGITQSGPVYREPGTPARLFIYAFALAAPLLTLGAVLIPAGLLVRFGRAFGGIAIASTAGLAYVAGMVASVRRVRVLASRFTPPLPLPGDIWSIGVAPPPRRSSNWPIRLRWRKRPPPGTNVHPERLAA